MTDTAFQANNDMVLSEARERFRLFRLARRIELDVQEPLIRWHLLQNPEQDGCSQCGIRERFSPGLQFTPLQQDRDRCAVAQILPPGSLLLADHQQGLAVPDIGDGKGIVFAALAPGDGDRDGLLIREAMQWRTQEPEHERNIVSTALLFFISNASQMRSLQGTVLFVKWFPAIWPLMSLLLTWGWKPQTKKVG